MYAEWTTRRNRQHWPPDTEGREKDEQQVPTMPYQYNCDRIVQLHD